MKANRKSIDADDAVSPVIAVILMVAITVVLAATVYLWVSGFGANQKQLVNASFGAKAIDLPWADADTDTADDAVEITLASADSDLKNVDITISVDGLLVTWNTANSNFYQNGTFTAGQWCTTSPGGDVDDNWERGGSVILIKTATGAALALCDGTVPAGPTATTLANTKGIHTVKIAVQGQVVLDTSLEIHDDANAN